MLRIGEAREARGWTQAKLAEAIGTTQQTVQRWESGQTDPKVSQIEAISGALGITVSFLLGINDGGQNDAESNALPDEVLLISLYRRMSAEGRARLMEQAEFLAERHPFLNQASMGA